MKNKFLLPNSFKWIGWIMLLPFLALVIASSAYEFTFGFLATKAPVNDPFGGNNNLTDELTMCGLMLSLAFISLAREKYEDEYVNSVRLQSFQAAVLMNYLVMAVVLFTCYGANFLYALYLNIPLLLLLFILIFYARLKLIPYFSKRQAA